MALSRRLLDRWFTKPGPPSTLAHHRRHPWLVMAAWILTTATFTWMPTLAANGSSGGEISNYTSPAIDHPFGMTMGPDGNLWFTDENNNAIGRITPSGSVTEFNDPRITNPVSITSGPDGALWFTNEGGYPNDPGSVGRITTAGVVTIYAYPQIVNPGGITVGPDGALWFIASRDLIGRITTAGALTTFSNPNSNSPYWITAGPDGALWFTDGNGNSIGRITTSGVVTTYTGPSLSGPSEIAPGPDGALWFTNGQDSIGRITTSGVITSFSDPSISYPLGIVAGNDGALWFTNRYNNDDSIGRITTAGTVTSFTDSTVNAPASVVNGPDGAVWFTNQGNGSEGSIGRITTGVSSWAPEILSATGTSFDVGDAGSFTVVTSSSPTATLTATGALPTGVTFKDNGNGTADLSGTPAVGTAGSYPITITARNSSSPDITQHFTMTVTLPSAPDFVSSADASATYVVGAVGQFTFVSAGTPTPTLSESGPLPAGVTFTGYGDGTADLFGTPVSGAGGVYPITVTASNAESPDATQTFTLTVDQAPSITSVGDTTFTAGTFSSFTVNATGYPPDPALTTSSPLPKGVSFTDDGNGTAALAGNAAPLADGGGLLVIDISADNGVEPGAYQTFVLTIDQAPGPIVPTLLKCQHRGKVKFILGVPGNPAPTISETGTIPAGLTFTGGIGSAVIKGTGPRKKGTYVLTINADNGIAPNATGQLTIRVK